MTRRSLSVLLLVVVVVGCGGSDGAKGPTATVGAERTTESTTTTTAKALTPEQEVEAAYLKSWDVYAKAVRTFDVSGLRSIYSGTALNTVANEVARLKRNSTPVKVAVDHDYHVQVVEPGHAIVVDSYVNHSVFVDPVSGEPTEPDPHETLVETYTVRDVEGSWMVVGIARQ
jgi:hypothetical protein